MPVPLFARRVVRVTGTAWCAVTMPAAALAAVWVWREVRQAKGDPPLGRDLETASFEAALARHGMRPGDAR